MCGIAGLVSPRDPDTEAVRRMTAALARRGPDGEGLDCVSGLALGHRRLSIFDLSDLGRQPMLTPDRRTAVVFNGAIYNFRPLRAELEARGFAFRSQTDTEVLLHGYRAWGIDGLLERIRGMFALGLWDDDRQTLWLVRDRLGVKPLYFAESPRGLAFASTARALRSAGLASELHAPAVADFLERGYVCDSHSIWQGVQKLGAGQVLQWSGGRIESLRDYWRPAVVNRAAAPSFADAVAETERLLLAAVERRLDADVPVGALLSDGIDSGLVCWAIAKLGGDITAFTVQAASDASDESEGAAATARQLGIRHKIIPVAANQAPDLEELVTAYGEPFACASALGMLQVSRAVRQEATVLLTGDGGDDVFLGYPEHRACWAAQRLAQRFPLGAPARSIAQALPRRWHTSRRASTLLLLATHAVAGWQQTQDRYSFYRQRNLLGPRLAAQPVPHPPVDDSPAAARRLVEEFLAYDRLTRFTGEYMIKVDGGTMHHALEARSPFLDQTIWEFAGALPVELRLHRGELKAILRALARQHLGARKAAGAKRGFTVPVWRWLAGSLRQRAAADLADSLLGREGWIDGPAAAQALRTAPDAEVPLQLWYLWVLEHWFRHERPGG